MFTIAKHNTDDNKVMVAIDNILELFEFFRWIETTQLFTVIKQETDRQGWIGVMPNLVSPEIQMHLQKGIPVSRATDLPVELILEFYSQYPLRQRVFPPSKVENEIIRLSETSTVVPIESKLPDILKITDQRREDMLIGAIEGGSNDWYWIPNESSKIIEKYNDRGIILFSIAMWKAIKDGARTIEINDNENRKEKLGEINLVSIEKGETKMFKEQPQHYMDIVNENDDATTADVWFQYAVLGSIVYG